MTSRVGYALSSLRPVHFGIGTDSRAQLIELRWPSGTVQTLENVDADRVLK
ncbi:MAG: ASPIC/UnbV domain-containing protein [Acidobacteriota bacterium]|nr:ASPIC/UnbV domain-containing protein [Acidobacteriota bacterium]